MAKKSWQIAVLAAALGLVLSGCGPAGVEVSPNSSAPVIPSQSTQASRPPAAPPPSNSPPVISGVPAASAQSAAAYAFSPTVSDADGDALSFTIVGKPAWASFNVATGMLTGIAQPGEFGGILISVSDGVSTTTLPPFTIQVDGTVVMTGTATLSWSPPNENTDGSALTGADLAGYRVYHGASRENLNEVQVISGATTTTFSVNQLPAGTHYFAVTAVTSAGVESAMSDIGSKTIL